MLLTLGSLVVVLGVLISVHEFGHFIVAKLVGIQVLRFSLGFGRPVIQWRRGETEYWISWIPLGGYVKMAGLEEEGMVGELEGGKAAVPIDPARAFDQKPLPARMAVILAGVTMNLFLAFAIYTGLVAIGGEPRLAMTAVDSVQVSRLPPGADALATLQRGDRITHINRDTLKTWDDLAERIIDGPAELQFRVAGRPEPIVVRTARDSATRNRLAKADAGAHSDARLQRRVGWCTRHSDAVVRRGAHRAATLERHQLRLFAARREDGSAGCARGRDCDTRRHCVTCHPGAARQRPRLRAQRKAPFSKGHAALSRSRRGANQRGTG